MNLEEINNFLKHENYYNSNELVNNPKPLPNQSEPTVSLLIDTGKDVEYSVIVPVHNQEKLILDNIKSIVYNMVGDWELIMIFDSCDDNSESIILDLFNKNNFSVCGLNRVVIIHQESPILETSCDNIGFRLSKSNFLLEIQADMKIVTFGFNYLLSKPLRTWDDVISVSGRCTHQIIKQGGGVYWGQGVGKMGESVEQPLCIPFDQVDKFFISDTVNRGPLMFNKSKLKDLGYLDEQNFFLGEDEHDLHLRARYERGWVCGYFPIEYYSPISWGTTRKESNLLNNTVKQLRKSRSNGGLLFSNRPHESVQLQVRTLDKNTNYRNNETIY